MSHADAVVLVGVVFVEGMLFFCVSVSIYEAAQRIAVQLARIATALEKER